jgi:malate dehydrogenase (oxaloacetate-decarboxylating)(NADP+)
MRMLLTGKLLSDVNYAFRALTMLGTYRTDGKVIFASGSPFKPISRGERTFEPGQGNNMYIFPGIGLGALLAKASRVTDSMVEQASVALAGSLEKEEREAGLVYPRLNRIREISAKIALAVVRAAQNSVRLTGSMHRNAGTDWVYFAVC